MTNKYSEKDTSLDPIKDKTIAVIGYGSQGRPQALCLKDSNLNIIVGLRPGHSFDQAKKDNITTTTVKDAVKQADIIHIVTPDESMADIYKQEIEPNLKPQTTLSFCHGLNIHFKKIIPPKDSDVILFCPKTSGKELREKYQKNEGVPGIIAIHQNINNAKELALAFSKALKFKNIYECTFRDECLADLFSEQAVICGSVFELVKNGFDILTNKGIPPEIAYFECMHELKLTVDLVTKHGLSYFYETISNTAEFGGLTKGKNVIDQKVKENMEKIFENVENGNFVNELFTDYKNNFQKLKELRENESNHPIEKIGKEIRKSLSNS